MKDTWQELARQPTGSENDTFEILVHSAPTESLAQHTKRLVDIVDHNPPADSVGDKLVREAQMLTWGVGEAFGGAVANPLSKAPELATAGLFGIGMKTLQKGGTGGKAIAGIVGAGMLAKMGYDELTGNRWSQFGHAMDAAWHSKTELDASIEATKNSVGSLAVDLTVGSLAFRGVGSREPISARSLDLVKGRIESEGMPPTLRESRAVFDLNKLPGERFLPLVESRSTPLGVLRLPLRRVRPAPVSEGTLYGERLSIELNDGASTHDLLVGSHVAKPRESLDATILSPRISLADGLKSKLLSGHVEEFGYLSAIREVAAVETAPNFRPSREAYVAIANSLRVMAKDAGSDYHLKYEEVARLVEQHALVLPSK